MKAVVFPGQGAQRQGMGKELFERYPQMLAEADELLGYSLAELCENNPDGRLHNTAYTQPALYVVCVLMYHAYVEEHGEPAFLAGHSIGEYAALYAAGVFSFREGLRLVCERGRLMAQVQGGAMAAVIGRDADGVGRLITDSGINGLEIANDNSPQQIVVAAPADVLKAFVAFCLEQGVRAVQLKVSGAFHSSHMAQPAAVFAEFLGDAAFQAPQCPVVSNVGAVPHGLLQLRENLAGHLCRPVRWTDSVRYLLDAGVEEFIELGPSPVLKGLIAQTRKHYSPAAFKQRFAGRHEVLVGALPKQASGMALVRALVQAGYPAALDADALDETQLIEQIDTLKADCAQAPWGISLSPLPGYEQRLQTLAGQAVPWLELQGFCGPSAALMDYRFQQPDAPRRLLVRVKDWSTLQAFLHGDDQAGYAPVDALCLDSEQWQDDDRDLLQRAVALRDQAVAGHAWREAPLIGLEGPADAEAAREARAMGADFVVLRSLLACSRESGLDEALKARLAAAGEAQFHWLADGLWPEFASRSCFFVADDIAPWWHGFERLYFEARVEDLDTPLESLASEAPEARKQLRLALRRHIGERDDALLCGPALARLNRQLHDTAMADWQARSAVAIADLLHLYPAPQGARQQ